MPRLATPSARSDLPAIVALSALGFSLTLLSAWLRHAPQLPALPGSSAAARAWRVVTQSGASRTRPAAPALGPDTAATHSVAATPPAQVSPDESPADESALPLPMIMGFSSHPARQEEDEEGSATVRSSATGRAYQLDLVSSASTPLELTVVAVDVPTQASTRTQLFLLPRAQAHLGAPAGLVLESGYHVIVRSRGYQELEGTVP